MNKNLILPALAFVIGAGVGFFVAKQMLEDEYAEIAQEEIDSVKEFYGRTSAERLAKQVEEAEEGSEARPNPNGALSRSSLDEGKTAYGQAKMAYHDLEKAKIMERWNEESTGDDAPPVDAAGYSEDDYVDDTTERDLSDVDRTQPYIISDKEYNEEFDHHDKLSICYYMLDDTLCDEQGEIIEDIDETVGWECFKMLERQTICWVRNEPLGIDYEICSVRNSYAQAVLGIGVGDTPREKYERKRKMRDGDDED